MRQVINKLIREEDLYGAVESAFSQGWRRVKLYFLTGLPTETDEDTLGIAELARNCVAVGRGHHKGASVTASVGGFVPKPQTPFQWFGQDTTVELQRKIGLLRDATRRDRGVQLRWHDPKASLAEGIASRGDRRIGAVIEDGLAAGRHLPGVVGALLPGPVDRGHGGPRPVDRLVRAPATATATRCCRGPTSRPACTRTSCGRTGRTPWPQSGRRIAAGRRATTAGPAPATASSTWWPRSTPPAGGSQGTGQDLSRGHEVPVQLRPVGDGGGSAP